MSELGEQLAEDIVNAKSRAEIVEITERLAFEFESGNREIEPDDFPIAAMAIRQWKQENETPDK